MKPVTFKVEIDMRGAAFDGDGAARRELARILSVIADRLTAGTLRQGGRLIDVNGNDCGRWRIINGGGE